MFGMQHTFKRLSGGIAIAAFLVAVATPSAFAGTFITDTLGGNGSPKATPDAFERAVAIHQAWQVRAQASRSQTQGMRFITDTLGGNGSPKSDVFERAVAIHEAQQAMTLARAVAQGYVSTVPYVNGGMSAAVAESIQAHHYDPAAYVNGGSSVQVAQAIQDRGYGRTLTPSVTGGSTGTTSFNWGDAGLGAGLAAALLLLLLGGNRLRGNRRSVLTA